MKVFNKLQGLAAVLLSICLFASAEAFGQSVLRPGYNGSLEIGTLIQKYPYITLSTSHGATNGHGLFFGGGAMVEMPIAVAPEFDSASAPYPGPFEKEKMLAVFAEIRYAVQGSSFAPFLDLKLGPAYNLDSKRYKNAFFRPSAGICFGHLSVSAGVEAAIGEYVDERYRDKKNLPAGFSSDITYGLYESFLPYVSVGYHF